MQIQDQQGELLEATDEVIEILKLLYLKKKGHPIRGTTRTKPENYIIGKKLGDYSRCQDTIFGVRDFSPFL